MADALAHVLRLFQSDTVPHEKGSVDPMRDLEDVEIELILSDLVVVEKRMERLDKDRKKIKSADLDREFALLERCKKTLEENVALRTLELTAEEEKRIRGFQFLSQKPMLFVLNIGEEDAGRLHEDRRRISQGTAGGANQHGGHGDLRQDRSGAGRAVAGRGARISGQLRPERIGARAADFGHLFAARLDVVL